MDPQLFHKLVNILPELVRTLKKFTDIMADSLRRGMDNVSRLSRRLFRSTAKGISSLFSKGAAGLRGMSLFARKNFRQQMRGGKGVFGKIGKIGPAIGAGAGAAIGFAFGGPAGAMVGGRIGATIGKFTEFAAGAGAAIYALGKSAYNTATRLLESQRKLAEFSPHMAQVFAESDIRQVRRSFLAGQQQSASTRFLAHTRDNLADTMQPMETMFANMKNIGVGIWNKFTNVLFKPFEWISNKINPVLEWIAKRLDANAAAGDIQTFGEWLDDIVKANRAEKAQMAAQTAGQKFGNDVRNVALQMGGSGDISDDDAGLIGALMGGS